MMNSNHDKPRHSTELDPSLAIGVELNANAAEIKNLKDVKEQTGARVKEFEQKLNNIDEVQKDTVKQLIEKRKENNEAAPKSGMLLENYQNLQKNLESNDVNDEEAIKIIEKTQEKNIRARVNSKSQLIMEQIWDGEKLQQQKYAQLKEALSPWASKNDPLGLHQFITIYNDPETKPEEKEKMRNALNDAGLSLEEAQQFIEVASGQFGIEYSKMVHTNESLNTALEKAKEKGKGAEYYAEFLHGIEEVDPNDEEALNEFIKQRTQEYAKQDDDFRQLYEKQQNERDVLNLMEERTAIKEAAENPPQDSQKIAQAMEKAGVGGAFNKLDAPVRQNIENIVRQGGAGVVAPMLRGNMQESDDGYVSQVSGVDIELNNNDGQLYIIGEHAKENLVNKEDYKLDPPNAKGFDDAYARMIVDQNDVFTLGEPAMRPVLRGLMGKFGDAVENGSIMQEDEANRFHNFIELIFGRDNIEGDEEVRRLERLGIMGHREEGGGQGFRVNNRRLRRIHRAMLQYVPRSMDERKAHARMDVTYDDFQTLADLWNLTDNDTILPPMQNLTELTEQLSDNPEERKRQLREYCVREGYVGR